MNFDPFTGQPIHHGEIWDGSQCLDHEKCTIDHIAERIQALGYDPADEHKRHWIRGDHKIVLCLVDDIRSCAQDYETDMPYLFDRETTVITDNLIMCPTQFRVLNVPHSFYGIYAHPITGQWQPDRQFCFSVNRLDDRRLKIMLEIAKRMYLHRGYVNFNCQTEFVRSGTDIDPTQLRQNFLDHWQNLSDQDKSIYQSSYDLLREKMPLKNYEISHDEIHLRSWCNIVVESYSSDTTVAFSEKIFRALTLPVPWTLYGGYYSVAFLESIGFDCMSDLIEHNHYDRLKEVEDKVHIFVWMTLKSARENMDRGQEQVGERCLRAADHNRALLDQFRKDWPSDLDQWCERHLS